MNRCEQQTAGAEPPPAARPQALPEEFGGGRLRLSARPPPAGPPAQGRLQQLLALACRAAQASRGTISLLSADGRLLELFCSGFAEGDEATLRRCPRFLEELTHAVLRRPVPTRGAVADLRLQFADLADTFQSSICNSQFLGIPLAGPGRCRGALCLLRPPEPPSFGQEDEQTVLPLGAWLEEGNLFEEARLLTQIRLLNQIAQAAAGNLDVARIFRTTLRELDRHLPLHVSAVWLLPEAGDRGARKAEGEAGAPPCTARGIARGCQPREY
jgi:GAF domain-containing protein